MNRFRMIVTAILEYLVSFDRHENERVQNVTRPGTRMIRINNLLISMFVLHEMFIFLQRHYGEEGKEMVHALPVSGASTTTIFYEIVLGLERRGRIDCDFFEALISERPHRATDIRRVQESLLS